MGQLCSLDNREPPGGTLEALSKRNLNCSWGQKFTIAALFRRLSEVGSQTSFAANLLVHATVTSKRVVYDNHHINLLMLF